MSRPLRSTMVPPRCFNTIPAPALMTMAMPAITAKAANRLPLTPHRGRKIFKGQRSLPIVNRPAIPPPPANVELPAAVSRYQVYKSGKFEAFAQFCEAPKQKGRREAGLSDVFDQNVFDQRGINTWRPPGHPS